MKQYTITEENDWEGETFGYIIDLSEQEYEYIIKNITNCLSLSLEETNYTPEQVETINKHSSNSYMPRLDFYEFKKDFFQILEDTKNYIYSNEDTTDTEKDEEMSYCLETEIFYKGVQLNRK